MSEFNTNNSSNDDLMHNLVQYFLEKFRKYPDYPKFTNSFKSNPLVYTAEIQIPELWLRTRNAFDKNMCFIFEDEKRFTEENMFPKAPYMVLDESALNSKFVKIDKVNVDDLFSSKKMQNFDAFSDEAYTTTLDKFDEKRKMFPEDEMSNKRKWFIDFPNVKNFGPYSSKEVLSLLKNLLKKEPDVQNNHSFMVCDSELDIYFQPDAALEIIENEVKEHSTTNREEKREMIRMDKPEEFDQFNMLSNYYNSKNYTPKSNFIQPSPNYVDHNNHSGNYPNLKERKFLNNSKMVTKYDKFDNQENPEEHEQPHKDHVNEDKTYDDYQNHSETKFNYRNNKRPYETYYLNNKLDYDGDYNEGGYNDQREAQDYDGQYNDYNQGYKYNQRYSNDQGYRNDNGYNNDNYEGQVYNKNKGYEAQGYNNRGYVNNGYNNRAYNDYEAHGYSNRGYEGQGDYYNNYHQRQNQNSYSNYNRGGNRNYDNVRQNKEYRNYNKDNTEDQFNSVKRSVKTYIFD